MRRLAQILFVVIVSTNLGGALGLFVPEPCGVNERAGTHATCAPTCAQCTCCRQPVVPMLPMTPASAVVSADDRPAYEPRILSADPREILHVPRSLTV